jgi:hypothetical protein
MYKDGILQRVGKIIVTLFAVMMLFSCSEQTNQSNIMKNELDLIKSPVTVGLGRLEISFDLPVPLYRIENEETPIDILSFKRSMNGVWHYKTKKLNSFKPYQMFGGDSNEKAKRHINMGLIRFPPKLAFRVLEATDTFYRIVIDEDSFETVVVRKDVDYAELSQSKDLFGGIDMPKDKSYKGYYAYETWEHLLKRAEFVNFRDNYSVYGAPNGNKIFENTDQKFLPYGVIEVSGDWIKVKKGIGRESNFKGIENAEGWVKWKDENKILVNITEYTVE